MKKKKLRHLNLNKFKVAQINNAIMQKGGQEGADGTSFLGTCRTADFTRCPSDVVRFCQVSRLVRCPSKNQIGDEAICPA